MAQGVGFTSRIGPRHISDYLRVLYKRRVVAVPAFLLVFVAAAVGSLRTVPVYEARTQLIIEKDAKRSTSLDTVLEERDSWYQDDFFPTQSRILQSRTLAARTAKALGAARSERVPSGGMFSASAILGRATSSLTGRAPASPAGEPAPPQEPAVLRAATNRVLAGLSVVPVRGSRLVDLRFASPDPEFAAVAVNTVADQYIAQSLEFRMTATNQANAWLTKTLEEQRKLVDESERRLQQFKEDRNAGSVDDKQNIVVQKLNALNQQLVDARLERLEREGTYQTVQEFRRNGTPLDTLPAVQTNTAVQRLSADLASKEAERAKLSTQYGPAYPPMRDLAKQIDITKAARDAEINKVVGAIQAEFNAARAKETGLAQSLDAQQREAASLDRKVLGYAAIEREASSNRQLYETLLARAKETGAAGEYRGTNIQILDRAEVPAAPVLPQTRRDLAIGATLGLVLAVALAFGVEYFDSRLKSPDEVKAHLDIPFLGMVPAFAEGERMGEAPLLHPEAPAAFAEAIRALRTAVLFSSADEGARAVVVTSTGPHEGKTVVSSSLAVALAQAGQRTVVVDADMRRPRMHEAIGRSQEPGLSNLLVGDTSLHDAVRPTDIFNLSVITAGHIPPNPVELLCAPRYGELIAELKTRFDWVIIDAPPVMPVTDAAVVANTASGVLFVVGAEMTPRRNAVEAITQLRAANAKFIGAVLNRVNITRDAYYYAPYYRKEYGKYYQRSARRA